jgi:hypothetical protein
MKLHVLGIDLGKTVFHLVGLDLTGRLVIRKRCSRRQLLAFTANLEVQLIGMEACSPLYEDESERISIMARSQRLQSRPNTLAQTNCHRSLFACNSAADHTSPVSA